MPELIYNMGVSIMDKDTKAELLELVSIVRSLAQQTQKLGKRITDLEAKVDNLVEQGLA